MLRNLNTELHTHKEYKIFSAKVVGLTTTDLPPLRVILHIQHRAMSSLELNSWMKITIQRVYFKCDPHSFKKMKLLVVNIMFVFFIHVGPLTGKTISL